jgi:tRNA(Ile)-lysidine synthase
MPRSHPPTLIRLAERTLRDECRLEPRERLLVATSGGGDSAALLHVLSILAPRLGLSIVAHGVDHGLRPEADGELDLAAALADRLDVPFGRTRVSVGPGGNLQARAREARRAALERAAAAASASRIATAHHADDRAETVLIRLLHGATPSGLAVLPAEDGRRIRPLIRARKADVCRHLARHRIPFADDPSNQDRRFLRARVRLELLPLLEDLSPGIVLHLTGLADDLAAGPSAFADEAGQPVVLRRAHVQALRHAALVGRAARVRLPRGVEIVVDPKARQLRMDRTTGGPETKTDEANGAGRQKGGAKPGKSG